MLLSLSPEWTLLGQAFLVLAVVSGVAVVCLVLLWCVLTAMKLFGRG